jgi:hypothetical protein
VGTALSVVERAGPVSEMRHEEDASVEKSLARVLLITS